MKVFAGATPTVWKVTLCDLLTLLVCFFVFALVSKSGTDFASSHTAAHHYAKAVEVSLLKNNREVHRVDDAVKRSLIIHEAEIASVTNMLRVSGRNKLQRFFRQGGSSAGVRAQGFLCMRTLSTGTLRRRGAELKRHLFDALRRAGVTRPQVELLFVQCNEQGIQVRRNG